jgi:hypothetical protein
VERTVRAKERIIRAKERLIRAKGWIIRAKEWLVRSRVATGHSKEKLSAATAVHNAVL